MSCHPSALSSPLTLLTVTALVFRPNPFCTAAGPVFVLLPPSYGLFLLSGMLSPPASTEFTPHF